MVTEILFFIIALFLLVSGLDYIFGNKLGLGNQFKKGVEACGSLALNMIGIYILAPLLTEGLMALILPVTNVLKVDPSLVPASLLAVDMGGYQLAQNLALNQQMADFSGILLASNLGATISFSIPVALGMIKKEDLPFFLRGLVIGIIILPFGSFIGGLVQGISFYELIRNCMPLFVLSLLLAYGTMRYTNQVVKCFGALSKIIVAMSVMGLILVGLEVVLGISFLPETMPPLSEAAEIVVRIGLFLAGAYPMLKVVEHLVRRCGKPVAKCLQVNEATIVGMIGSLASNLLTFAEVESMNAKGKVLASAVAISGAFVLGGQLAFVSTLSSEMVTPFIVSKLSGAILAIVLVQVTYKEG